jgi:hypothetical protein
MASEPKSTEATFVPNPTRGLARFNAIEITIVLLGLSLCSLGTIGMVVGIPIVLAAIYSAYFIPPKFNRGLYLGKCPHCGAAVSATHYQTQIDCPDCGAESKIENSRFIAIPKRPPPKQPPGQAA